MCKMYIIGSDSGLRELTQILSLLLYMVTSSDFLFCQTKIQKYSI